VSPPDGSTPRIVAMGEGEGFARAVILVLRRRALEVLTARTEHYVARLGAPMPKVSVADAKAEFHSRVRLLFDERIHPRYPGLEFVTFQMHVQNACRLFLRKNKP
jgi:hypothetical protein